MPIIIGREFHSRELEEVDMILMSCTVCALAYVDDLVSSMMNEFDPWI